MENLTGPKGFDARAFNRWERLIAGALGLTQDEIREIREKSLRPKEHWITHKRRIMYSPQGEQELIRLVKASERTPTPATPHRDNAEVPGALPSTVAKKNADKKGAPEIITLKVFRSGLAHSQIIEAHFPDKDPANVKNRVRVRVRSDKHFTRGMEIPVTWLQEGLYLLARACPRSKGKW